MGVMGKLMLCGTVALIISALGQSVVAVLNDVLAVVSAGSVDGRPIFSLQYGYHAITTMIAHGCAAGAATLHAVGVSILRQTVAQGDEAPRVNRTIRPVAWQ